jgi:S-adenosylmethionine hydrolase
VAVIDSFGFVAVCVVNGNASRELGVGIGEQIRVKFLSV